MDSRLLALTLSSFLSASVPVTLLVGGAVLCCGEVRAAEPPVQAAPVDLENVARDTVRELVDGKYDEAIARFTPNMQRDLPRAKIAAVLDPVRSARGPARSVIARLRRDQADGLVSITVKANWTRGKPSDVRVVLRPDGVIAGVHIADETTPQDESKIDAYEVKSKLRPPFAGTWTARNAGRDSKNSHWLVRAQRHAVDWLVEGPGGATHEGGGKRNEDYLAYGKPALAVADGTVVIVVDGVPENPTPGVKDPYFVPGNHVVIDLGGGEFAMYMHLQPGVAVKVGQKVAAGAVVGRVGNSGNSTEPHLHFQIADKARLAECVALPAKFSDVTLDGKKAARAYPDEGSKVGE